MKFLTLAVLATTILASTANASISSNKISRGASAAAIAAIGTTASPTVFAMAAIECLGASDSETRGYACGGATVTAPVSSSVLLLLLKEDIAQVEADAYNTLAGEEISLALEEQINKMRETFPALAEESDEFVIASMLELQTLL